jgi:tetratricopeptide (TPR) repeat protein
MRAMETPVAVRYFPPVKEWPAEVTAPKTHSEALSELTRAERLVDEHRYADAIESLSGVEVPATSDPALAVRILYCESWARMYLGDLEQAVATLERARALVEGPTFTDRDRAEALFRLGCCRVKLAKVSNAIAIFTAALGLLPESAVEEDRLRSRIFDWRSRCYQLQREWDLAQVDAERSLELAQSVGDDRLRVRGKMQCSLVAERRGDTMLAKFYAERALTLATHIGDTQTAARLLNNLGGLMFLLGDSAKSVAYLKQSFSLSLEIGNEADAAQAISSLAQVHLRSGAPQLAEEQAREALKVLAEREDYQDERGNVHLVLGRALLKQGRVDEALAEFAAAEWLFEAIGSKSHVAAAWTAQGEAYEATGDLTAAVTLYRRAAEALQDFHF